MNTVASTANPQQQPNTEAECHLGVSLIQDAIDALTLGLEGKFNDDEAQEILSRLSDIMVAIDTGNIGVMRDGSAGTQKPKMKC